MFSEIIFLSSPNLSSPSRIFLYHLDSPVVTLVVTDPVRPHIISFTLRNTLNTTSYTFLNPVETSSSSNFNKFRLRTPKSPLLWAIPYHPQTLFNYCDDPLVIAIDQDKTTELAAEWSARRGPYFVHRSAVHFLDWICQYELKHFSHFLTSCFGGDNAFWVSFMFRYVLSRFVIVWKAKRRFAQRRFHAPPYRRKQHSFARKQFENR